MKPKPAVQLVAAITEHHPKPTRLLRPAVVADRIAVSLPTLWRMRRRGDFPQPIKLSPGTVAWKEADIEAWIAQRIAESA